MIINKKKFGILLLLMMTAIFASAQIEVVHDTGDADELGQNPVTENELPDYQVERPDFDQIWKNYKDLMLRNSYDDAIAEISRLISMKENRKIERLTFYALALTVEAYDFYKKTKDEERSIQLLNIARSLDSKLPDVYFLPFYIKLQGGFKAFGKIGDFITGIKVSFNDHLNMVSTISVIIGLLIKSLLIAGLIFTAILFYRFQRNLRYDAAALDIFGNNESMKKFAGWFFLFLPFVFWLGFEYILLYLIVALIPYAKPSLKIAGLIIIIGLIFYVPWLKYNNALVKTINDENATFALLADNDFYTHDLNEKVIQHRKNDKNNPNLEITQARVLMYYGRMSEAYNAFRILNKKYPNRTDILITLGNIRYYNGTYELAKLHYEEAMKLNPDNVYALFNYKLAIEQMDPFRDTTDLKRQIMALNPEFYDSVTTSEGEKKELIEIYLPKDSKIAEWNEILRGYLFEDKNEGGIMTLISSSPLSIVSLVGFLGFFILMSYMRKSGHAEKCQKCLRVFKQPARGEDLERKYCKQCVTIFFKKEGVSPEVQRAKIVQINQTRKKERNIKILLSFIIPGARNLYSDRGFSGFLILWKWVFLILVIFSGLSLNINPFRAVDLQFGPMKILALILLIQTQITSIILGFTRMNKAE